jgi:hypothetical protein
MAALLVDIEIHSWSTELVKILEESQDQDIIRELVSNFILKKLQQMKIY